MSERVSRLVPPGDSQPCSKASRVIAALLSLSFSPACCHLWSPPRIATLSHTSAGTLKSQSHPHTVRRRRSSCEHHSSVSHFCKKKRKKKIQVLYLTKKGIYFSPPIVLSCFAYFFEPRFKNERFKQVLCKIFETDVFSVRCKIRKREGIFFEKVFFFEILYGVYE